MPGVSSIRSWVGSGDSGAERGRCAARRRSPRRRSGPRSPSGRPSTSSPTASICAGRRQDGSGRGKSLLASLAGGGGWLLVNLDPAGAVYMRADVLAPPRLAEGPFPPGRDRRETYEALARRLDLRTFDGPPIREIALGEFFSV